MNGHNERDAMEAFLRQADRRVQQFLKDAGRERRQLERVVRLRADEAIRKGAGGLRQRLDDLHDGLETLSARLTTIEGRRRATKPAARKSARQAPSRSRSTGKPASRKTTARRTVRRKKAA